MLSSRPLALVLVLLAAMPLAHAETDLPERQHIMELVAAGQDGAALEAARDWTLSHPDRPEALLLYATLQENADDVSGALESLDSAYFLTRSVDVLVRKGYVYMRSGQRDQAQQQFRKALRQQETSVAAHLGLARVMMEAEDYQEAGAAARAALWLEPQSAEAQVVLGHLTLLSGRTAEAQSLLEQAVRQQPDCAEAYLWLGRVYGDLGRPADSHAAWKRHVALAPTEATAWLLARNLYPGRATAYACSGYRPTFSPDGKLLASTGRGDSTSVYLSPVDHPELSERLYQAGATIMSLDWSPDSKHLLCRTYAQATVDGKQQYTFRLAAIEARPGAQAVTLREDRNIGQPCWAPDGKSVYFDGYVVGKGRAIVSVPLTGGEPTPRLLPQLQESFYGCWWLPDGKRLLLQRWMQSVREYQLLLCDPADRSKDVLLAHSAQSLASVAVSPRGDYAFYYRRLGQPPMWNLMVVPLDQSALPHPLGLRNAHMLPPALTADQKHMLLYSSGGMLLYDLQGIAGEQARAAG